MKFVIWWTTFAGFIFLFVKLDQIARILTNILVHLQGNV
jgi:hypothetical protein